MIATPQRTAVRRLPLLTLISASIVAVVTLLTGAPTASAIVSANVRNACMADYFEHCAGMEVGSQELRRCFNRAGPKLQPGCVRALISAGEVSQAEVNRRGGIPSGGRQAARPKAQSTRAASRATCVTGPARPGASSVNSCRVASKGKRASRQYARN